MSKSRIRVLRMESNQVYYTPTSYVFKSKTNLAGYNIQFAPNTYWKVEIVKFDSNTNEVLVKVIDYKCLDIESFNGQTSSIQLENLKFYHLLDSKLFVNPIQENRTQIPKQEITKTFEITEELYKINYPISELEFQEEEISLNLKKHLFLEKVNFDSLQITIPQSFSRNQLNAIKPFIKKRIGAETVEVDVKVKNTKPGMFELSGSSNDLVKIDESIIERAKYDHLLQAIAKSSSGKIQTPKSFSPEEFAKEQLSIIINPVKTIEFLNDLNKIKQALHFKHIEYLCSEQNEYFPIRFITFPVFAFLIVMELKDLYYAILECYDKPLATYVWQFKKTGISIKEELFSIYKEVEKEVIKASKRMEYIQIKPDNFFRLEHDYTSNNGFELWKREFETRLGIK